MAGFLRQHSRIDAQQRQGLAVTLFDRRVENTAGLGADIDPAVAAEFVFELTAPQPLYKKWWFWTAIGGGVAVIVVSGIAIGVATSSMTPTAAPYPPGTPVYQPMF